MQGSAHEMFLSGKHLRMSAQEERWSAPLVRVSTPLNRVSAREAGKTDVTNPATIPAGSRDDT